MTTTRHGTMTTPRAARYAKQLAGHWARRGTVEESGDATTIRFEDGSALRMVPQEHQLLLELTVPDGDTDRMAGVVKDHLERFGLRDELEVVWATVG